MEELLRAIARVIGTKYAYAIHLQNEKIQRPCFQIYVAAENETDVNKAVVKNDLAIQIVFFVPKIVNELGEVLDELTQNEVVYNLKKAFGKQMYFLLSDSKVFINACSKGYTGDKDIYLQLDLTRYSNREIDDEAIELMKEINVNM